MELKWYKRYLHYCWAVNKLMTCSQGWQETKWLKSVSSSLRLSLLTSTINGMVFLKRNKLGQSAKIVDRIREIDQLCCLWIIKSLNDKARKEKKFGIAMLMMTNSTMTNTVSVDYSNRHRISDSFADKYPSSSSEWSNDSL